MNGYRGTRKGRSVLGSRLRQLIYRRREKSYPGKIGGSNINEGVMIVLMWIIGCTLVGIGVGDDKR